MTPRPTRHTLSLAAERLAGQIHRTPLLASRTLTMLSGTNLRFKAENLQVTGSFKIRGAFNKVSEVVQKTPDTPGVVTASSGNHGQAVAWAARHFGLPARIVVPRSIPAVKAAAIEGYGATLEYCGTTSRERLARAEALAHDGWTYVPPYDDVAIMSGQGTIGLEILADWPHVDTVLVPVGGGGLISGIASAMKFHRPEVRVIGVEPQGAAKATAARQAGQAIELLKTSSIADGLLALSLGTLTAPIVLELVDDVVTVSEENIIEAMWLIMSRLKVTVEPSGAAAAAYALSPPYPFVGRNVAVVLSGGNLDRSLLPRISG